MASEPTDNFIREIEAELAGVGDPRIVAAVRARLVAPRLRMMDWDYGPPGQQYACWTVFDDGPASGTEIVHCEHGFGPRRPWGLVFAESDGHRRSMGMDSGWFSSFMAAYYDSFAAAELAIWRVFATGSDGESRAVSEAMVSDAAWRYRDALAAADPRPRYEVRPDATSAGGSSSM